ncbi:MAG: hypothetical protein ACI9R3_004434 [Verrucomicrobiales bacterium]|jgi:hypothetical protein
MSVAEKLIEKGKAEGKAEGVWIGKVQLMEEMLGIEQSQQLAQLSLSELEERFLALQKRYQSKFKEQ